MQTIAVEHTFCIENHSVLKLQSSSP
jgi:hypothetical protein